jgi:hypothetical protein
MQPVVAAEAIAANDIQAAAKLIAQVRSLKVVQ